MNIPKQIDVYYNKGQHIARLMTGLHLLEEDGRIKCNYIENTGIIPTPHEQVVELRWPGRRAAFDLGDRSGLNHKNATEYLSEVDYYFERSHEKWNADQIGSENLHKVKPYGFDYYVTYPGNPAMQNDADSRQRMLSFVRDITAYSKCMHIGACEQGADYKADNIRILFMTRLWDPDEISLSGELDADTRAYREYMIYERNKINADRIAIVKELRKQYGPMFYGGIQEGVYAARACPDIILPRNITRKAAYLKKMKASDICIGSAGLHRSIGWKTGEYVAASRAIVSERFVYHLPGNFEENKNYIPYDDVEGCLEAVARLYSDVSAIYQMKIANEQYYRDFLRPERQIGNALNCCGLSLDA